MSCTTSAVAGRAGWAGCACGGPVAQAPRSTAAMVRGRFGLPKPCPKGDHHDLVLKLSSTALDPQPPDAGQLWEAITTAWREVMPKLGDSIAPGHTRHSYAVLRGLTSSG